MSTSTPIRFSNLMVNNGAAIDKSRELVRGARNDLAAANDRWEIRKAGESLAYRLLVGDSFRTLVFSPPLGGFTCDSFQDLRFHSDSKLVLVATLGGICGYDADGKWINLHDDLDGDQQPDAVRNLDRTEKGLICSLGGTTPSFFLLTGEQIPEHTWCVWTRTLPRH